MRYFRFLSWLVNSWGSVELVELPWVVKGGLVGLFTIRGGL